MSPATARTGYALAAAQRAVEGLIAAGRGAEAARLALAAALRLPGSPVLAGLLEKALSCAGDYALAERAYKALLARPGVYPGNYYWLAMFRKRAGDEAGMRRAFEGFLEARGGDTPLHAYIACCTLDLYAEAFRAAEQVLAAPPPDAVLSRLWNPWGDRSSAMPAGFLHQRLERLEKAEVPAELEHYRTFLRGALLYYSGDWRGALKALGRLPRLDAGRYGWMRLPAGLAALYLCDFRRAEKEFSVSEKSAVSRVTSMGRLAEVYACTGRPAAAFRKIRAAQKLSPLWARAGLLAWEGQLLLFTGYYKEALKPLTLAGEGGDDAAWCWRGAALLKLGRAKAALADLDRAVALFPTDWEARNWRAEALRRAGRRAEALADLEAVLAHAPNNWAYINRALLRGDAGDERGMREDLGRVAPEIRRALARRAGGGARSMLELAGELALGDRRDEKYFSRVWLGRFTSRRPID